MSALAKSSLKYFKQNNNQPQGKALASLPGIDQQRAFTCFSRLPAEIRFKIWSLAAPRPQNIAVQVKYATATLREELGTYACTSWHTTGARQVANILHVNHESRLLMLKSYTLVFDRTEHPQGFPSPSSGRIYVDWERDTICPRSMNKLRGSPIPGLFEQASVRNIALNVRDMLDPVRELRPDGCLNIQSLFKLANLEDVIFYYSDEANNAVDAARGLCLKFDFLDENFIVKDLCMMPPPDRPSLSYLLAARKTVYKDYDVFSRKRKVRDDLERVGEEVPVELRSKEIDRISERKCPTVRLAYLALNGKYTQSADDMDRLI